MRRNPERVAWVVLLCAFGVFCLIVVAIPLGISRYIHYSEKEQKALVESLVGTVVVEPALGTGPIPLSKGRSMAVSEGSTIRVDETSEAAITFFDHSFMRLFSGTTVRLQRSRAPRFEASALPNRVYLQLLGGRIQGGTALPIAAALDFRVATLHAEVQVDADASFAVEATNELSEVIVYRGEAAVTALGQTVALETRQRTAIALGQPPQAPMGMARSLIVDDEFAELPSEGEPRANGWRLFNDQGTDGGEVDGHVDIVVDEGRRAVRFSRRNAEGNHCETILEQAIDKELPDPLSSLVVRATVKLRYQNLSGGGYLSSEYPLMIRVTYRDVYDSEAEWIQGFYYQNVSNNPTMYGLQIPQDRWFLYESGNLLESLPIRPYKIVRVRVYASGWDYESLISDINLIVE
ncbi:MAG: FecR domain-containing protein [Chloroflexi bacterium]|nr:FecR domain-containing protein [Chloroflexota bacterium]